MPVHTPGCAPLFKFGGIWGRKLHKLSVPERYGHVFWYVRAEQLCLCSRAGSRHFQSFPDRETLEGALHHKCGNCNTGPTGGVEETGSVILRELELCLRTLVLRTADVVLAVQWALALTLVGRHDGVSCVSLLNSGGGTKGKDTVCGSRAPLIGAATLPDAVAAPRTSRT